MAAGLPVIVSDWDGYKDTVRHEQDGFRIPTLSPAPGTCNDLAYRHAYEIDSYDMYIGQYSTLVAIQQERLSSAFIALCNSEELRKEMGASGAKRASETFDWKTIVPQYKNLWNEQASLRLFSQQKNKNNNKKPKGRALAWPARPDPSIGFANYASNVLENGTILTPSFFDADTASEKFEQYEKLAMINYSAYTIPTALEARNVFSLAATSHAKKIDLQLLLSAFADKQRGYKVIAFLTKLGFFTF